MSSIECDLLRVGYDARVHVSQVSFPPRLLGHQLPESWRAGTQDLGGERHHQACDDGRPRGVRSCGEEVTGVYTPPQSSAVFVKQ